MSEIDRIREILKYDIDPEFLRTAAIMLAWEYDQLFERICKDDEIPTEFKLEEFAKQKAHVQLVFWLGLRDSTVFHSTFEDYRVTGNASYCLKLAVLS